MSHGSPRIDRILVRKLPCVSAWRVPSAPALMSATYRTKRRAAPHRRGRAGCARGPAHRATHQDRRGAGGAPPPRGPPPPPPAAAAPPPKKTAPPPPPT